MEKVYLDKRRNAEVGNAKIVFSFISWFPVLLDAPILNYSKKLDCAYLYLHSFVKLVYVSMCS